MLTENDWEKSNSIIGWEFYSPGSWRSLSSITHLTRSQG